MAETTYVKAITGALAEAMRADDRVFVLGEDVAEGGPYTATAGLAEEFGTGRVIDTPISEAAITGVAIGAAQSGMRPVLEIMFVDFVTLALDQLANAAAKAHFMSGGQLTVPMVVRTQGGAGQRGAAQHSQSLESWLTHVPGLKVVMPSRAVDAAGLLAASIRDPNPVVLIENKTLYFRREEVPDELPAVELGVAATLREGRDVTIVALSPASRSEPIWMNSLLAVPDETGTCAAPSVPVSVMSQGMMKFAVGTFPWLHPISEPLVPEGPCGPGSPWGPCAPSAPSAPFAPSTPSAPAGPCGPGSPCGPCAPSAPSAPSAPAGPCGPVGPSAATGPEAWS